jgi:flagellar protein FliO/FliZ
MTLEEYVQFAVALIFVVFLIVAVGWLLRRFGFSGIAGASSRQRRLAVVEVLALDAKRRLILVRRDDHEHLILLGPAGDRVVEAGIQNGFRGAMAASTVSAPAPTEPGVLTARKDPT